MTSWITTAEAAARLNKSVRTIERYIKAGKIQSRKQAREGTNAETLCHASDIDALQPAAFLLPAQAPAEESRQLLRTGGTIAPPHGAPSPPDLATALATALATIGTQARTATEPRPWLTAQEASAISGLSRRFLRNLIASGKVKAVKDGRAWKYNHKSLLEWTPEEPVSDSASEPTARRKSTTNDSQGRHSRH